MSITNWTLITTKSKKALSKEFTGHCSQVSTHMDTALKLCVIFSGFQKHHLICRNGWELVKKTLS